MDKDILKEEYTKLKALEAVSTLEGVVLLKEYVKGNVVTSLSVLLSVYMEKSDSEIKALCSTIKANLDLYQLITGNAKQIEAIEEMLDPK